MRMEVENGGWAEPTEAGLHGKGLKGPKGRKGFTIYDFGGGSRHEAGCLGKLPVGETGAQRRIGEFGQRRILILPPKSQLVWRAAFTPLRGAKPMDQVFHQGQPC